MPAQSHDKEKPTEEQTGRIIHLLALNDLLEEDDDALYNYMVNYPAPLSGSYLRDLLQLIRLGKFDMGLG